MHSSANCRTVIRTPLTTAATPGNCCCFSGCSSTISICARFFNSAKTWAATACVFFSRRISSNLAATSSRRTLSGGSSRSRFRITFCPATAMTFDTSPSAREKAVCSISL